MSVVRVVDVHRVTQTRCKVVGRGHIAACEQPTGQDAQPPRDWIAPCPMLGRQMDDMLRGRITQACASLHAALQGLGAVWNVTPVGDEPADRQAPGGLEMINHPSIARHRRQWLHDVREMSGPIRTGAGLPKMPHELARRDDAGGQERAHPMADVLVLALFRCARLHRLGGVRAWYNLQPGLFVGADHDAPWLGETERRDRELTEVVRFGFAVGSVAIAPVHTPMRREVGRLQDTPQTGATHGPQSMLGECGDPIVETPSGGRTRIRGRFLGRHRQHIHPLRGGKSAADDPSAAHLAGR
jgi:hypothetical protein